MKMEMNFGVLVNLQKCWNTLISEIFNQLYQKRKMLVKIVDSLSKTISLSSTRWLPLVQVPKEKCQVAN